MGEVAKGVGEEYEERREGNEKVGQLTDGPVSEEPDVPVSGLNVVVYEGDGIVAPLRRRRGKTKDKVCVNVVSDEGCENARRRKDCYG
jgi:hypothetical protein